MKVSVVGSLNMDMTATAQRIPLKGETLKGESLKYVPGGKGANQAVAMAKLGMEVEMFGCIGDDDNGKALVDNLKKYGIKTDNIKKISGCPTGMAIITVAENDNTIIVIAGANGKVDKKYIDEIKEELLKSDIVLLQHEIPGDTVQYIVDLCYEHDVKVILNPAPAMAVPEEVIDKVTYITPNEHEASIIFGSGVNMEKLLKKYPEKLIITRGSKGVSTALKDGKIITIPARKTEVVDTTGAGDTLNGAFTSEIAKGRNIEEALKFANIAASLSIGKFGAQGGMPAYDEVMKIWREEE